MTRAMVRNLPLVLLSISVLGAAQDQPATSTDTDTSQPATTTASKDTQAVAVLGQSLAAMGTVQDSLAVGTITFADGRTASIKAESKGAALRHTITFPDHEYVYVANGGAGYMLKDEQKQELAPWAVRYQRSEQLPALSRLADFVQTPVNVKFVGTETVNGRPAYHVRLSNVPENDTPVHLEDLMSEFHVFIDTQTFLVVKTRSYLFSPDAIENRTEVETYYSDYRNVNGAAVPFHLTRYISGQKYSDVVFTGVILNSGLPDADFQ